MVALLICTSLRFTKYGGLLHVCVCVYLGTGVYWCHVIIHCSSTRTTVCPYINMLWKLHQLTPQWQCTFPRCTVGPLPHKNKPQDKPPQRPWSKQWILETAVLCLFLRPPQWWQKVLGRIVHNGKIWHQETEQHSDDLYLRTWSQDVYTQTATKTEIKYQPKPRNWD